MKNRDILYTFGEEIICGTLRLFPGSIVDNQLFPLYDPLLLHAPIQIGFPLCLPGIGAVQPAGREENSIFQMSPALPIALSPSGIELLRPCVYKNRVLIAVLHKGSHFILCCLREIL